MEKAEIRKQILKARRELSPGDCLNKSLKIRSRILSIQPYLRARVIMTYVSFGKEVDTRALISQLIEDDKTVCVPRIQGENVESVRITSLEDLAPSGLGMGILEPKPHQRRLVAVGRIDLVIVPIVAFDATGGRIGYGRGYYDRYLADISPDKIYGLAFDFQEVDVFPKESHDILIPTIITETRIIICS